MRDGLLFPGIDRDIILERLGKQDVGEEDFFQLAVRLDENKVLHDGCGLLAVEIIPGLIGRAKEALERDRFQQVVQYFEFESLQGIFLVGGSQDHLRLYGDLPEKFYAGKVRHFDVQEQEVDGLTFQHRVQLQRIFAHAAQIQKIDLTGITLQSLAGKRLIVNYDTFDLSGHRYW